MCYTITFLLPRDDFIPIISSSFSDDKTSIVSCSKIYVLVLTIKFDYLLYK